MALTDAANVKVETITSSPAPTRSSSRARCNAAVPLESATPWARPATRAASSSKAVRSGPTGATQFESRASISSRRSASRTSGGDR